MGGRNNAEDAVLNPGFLHDKGGGFRVKVGQQALQTLNTKA